MVKDPRSVDEIYESLKGNLEGRISKLTNFTDRSFNQVWLREGFSTELEEIEIALTALQLSGFVDYAGGVTESDINSLGLTDVSADDINQYLEDSNLDNIGALVGIERDQGSKATATVTFTVSDTSVTVPEGTEVSTQPDAEGNYKSFFTDSSASPDSGTTVDVNVTAEEVGTDYNIGSGTLTHLPSPPPGTESVTNSQGTSGGEDKETNDELRDRIKNAIFETSGGGTTSGIQGYIIDNTGASDVAIDEVFESDTDRNYPHGHVIVVAGTDSEVLTAIDESHPAGVEHILERPKNFTLDVNLTVTGTDVDSEAITENVRSYIAGLGLSDDVIDDKIIQNVMNSDNDIDDITSLSVQIVDDVYYLDGEPIDDFEDNDIAISDSEWGNWSGDTGSFSAQDGTVIDGSYSGELNSSNANVSVNTTRSTTTNRSLEAYIQIDNQTTNSSDHVRLQVQSGNTSLGYLEFDGSGNIDWYDGTDNNITSWTAGTTHQVFLDFDFANDQVDINVDGTTSTQSLQNSVSAYDQIDLINDTTSSSSTVNAYIDDIVNFDPVVALDQGDQLKSDGITQVTGTVDGSSYTFTEDTDYQELNNDSIDWSLSGEVPDFSVNTLTFTFDESKDIYKIGDELVQDGIVDVTDAGGTTYTEDTDYQEFDNKGTGRHDSIDWSLAGSTPDDGQDFDVTFVEGTEFQVTYDVSLNVTMTEREYPVIGTVAVTVA